MSKKSVEASVYDIVRDILKDTVFEIIDVEYVKEGPFKYLRVYADKPEGITIDDCSDISRSLNKRLDELDLIKEQYFLEVSSPGIERPFKTESDYLKNLNEIVEAKFYKPIEGKKALKGVLLEKHESFVVIDNNGEAVKVELKDISKINRVAEV